MKKICVLLALICLLTLGMTAACAENVQLSFVGESGNANAGYACEVKVKAKPAPAEDVTVTLSCKDQQEKASFVLPAGETGASCALPESWLQEKGNLTITFEEGEGYSFQKNAKYKVKVYAAPRVLMEKAPGFGFVGKKLTFNVKTNQPGNILKGNNVFQLRNQKGEVLCEKAWPMGSQTCAFVMEVTEEMVGKHLVTVWLGDKQVSEMEGTIAVADLSKPIVQKVDTQAPYMAITVDCAYAVHHTDRLLEVLDENDVTATFFMTGYFLRQFEESARKIEAAGHEIASHSNTHPRLTEKAGYDMMREIQRPAEDIMAMFGKETTLMRPPFGDVDKNVIAMARAEGQEVIMWTIDSHDWDWDYKHEDVVKRVTKDVGPGTIILFHLDGFWTPEVLAEVLPYYQEELGLKVVTVTELLSMEGKGPDARLEGDVQEEVPAEEAPAQETAE